jgi:hypothetical protein
LLVGEDAPALSSTIAWSVTKLASITFWSLAFSYWFDKPWFHKLRETCCCAPHTFLLGFPTGCLNIAPSACHLKNYCFVITYLLENEQELSLGMLDTSQTYQ